MNYKRQWMLPALLISYWCDEMKRFLVLLLTIIVLSACSKVAQVLPDKKDEYKKSEALPDLEVPPDLTANSSDAMNIPGEGTTLSRYKQQTRGNARSGSTSSIPEEEEVEEPWVAVRGSQLEVWSKLRSFFAENQLTLSLDAAELGILETDWTQPLYEGDTSYRNKFKIFSEAGEDPEIIVLHINNLRQERVMKDDGTFDWVDRNRSSEAERILAGELNLFFNRQQQTASDYKAPARARAEIKDLENGKILLSIPQEFTYAWHRTEQALERAGFVINDMDQSKGLYYITFYDTEEKKKGWVSRLAFWKGDGSEGVPYQISLTGVGDKTEIIVLSEEGDWESNDDTDKVLSILQTEYNRL